MATTRGVSVLRCRVVRARRGLPARQLVHWFCHHCMLTRLVLPRCIFCARRMPARHILRVHRSIRRDAVRCGRVLQCERADGADIRVPAWARVPARVGDRRAVSRRSGMMHHRARNVLEVSLRFHRRSSDFLHTFHFCFCALRCHLRCLPECSQTDVYTSTLLYAVCFLRASPSPLPRVRRRCAPAPGSPSGNRVRSVSTAPPARCPLYAHRELIRSVARARARRARPVCMAHR